MLNQIFKPCKGFFIKRSNIPKTQHKYKIFNISLLKNTQNTIQMILQINSKKLLKYSNN